MSIWVAAALGVLFGLAIGMYVAARVIHEILRNLF